MHGSRSIVRLFCYRPARQHRSRPVPSAAQGSPGCGAWPWEQAGGLLEAPATPTPAHSLSESRLGAPHGRRPPMASGPTDRAPTPDPPGHLLDKGPWSHGDTTTTPHMGKLRPRGVK